MVVLELKDIAANV